MCARDPALKNSHLCPVREFHQSAKMRFIVKAGPDPPLGRAPAIWKADTSLRSPHENAPATLDVQMLCSC